MAADVEELAYETSVRALQDQAGEINQLRSQTGTLLAAGSTTASFLGAQTLSHGGKLGAWGWLALAAFAISTFAAIYVLLPKSGLVFSLNADVLYDELRRDD